MTDAAQIAKALTPAQRKALQGDLTGDEFSAEGMGLFALGIVSLDPLMDGPRAFPITDLGRAVAAELKGDG